MSAIFEASPTINFECVQLPCCTLPIVVVVTSYIYDSPDLTQVQFNTHRGWP